MFLRLCLISSSIIVSLWRFFCPLSCFCLLFYEPNAIHWNILIFLYTLKYKLQNIFTWKIIIKFVPNGGGGEQYRIHASPQVNLYVLLSTWTWQAISVHMTACYLSTAPSSMKTRRPLVGSRLSHHFPTEILMGHVLRWSPLRSEGKSCQPGKNTGCISTL